MFAEYYLGHFVRRFEFSNGIDKDKVKVYVTDGVLKLTLPGHQLELGDWLTKSVTSAGALPVDSLDTVQADHIRYILGLTKGKIRGEDGAARLLGIKPTTLESRMRKLGIRNPRTSEIS